MKSDSRSRIDKILDRLDPKNTPSKGGSRDWQEYIMRQFQQVFAQDDESLFIYCIEHGRDWIPHFPNIKPWLARLPADRLADIRRGVEYHRDNLAGILRDVDEVAALGPAERAKLAQEKGWR